MFVQKKNLKRLQSTAAKQNEQSFFSTRQVHFPALMSQFEGPSNGFLVGLPMVLTLGFKGCAATSPQLDLDYTPLASDSKPKWGIIVEPRSVNRMLRYDIMSLAVWFWPAHERGEGLLIKLC